jgi:PAS domain S-box-containing protein
MRRYVAAVVFVAIAAVGALATARFFGGRAPLFPFTTAVLAAAVFGGLGPGIAATALSVVVVRFWFAGAVSVMPATPGPGMPVFFAVLGVLVSIVTDRLLRGRARLVDANRELQRANDRIQESEGRLKLAQQAAHCGVWDWNIQTREAYWSEVYYGLYGHSPSVRPSVENWLACIVPEDRERAKQEWEDAVSSGREYGSEFRIRRRGETRWIAAHGRTITDAAGHPLRLTGINLDITDRKHIEDELAEQTSELSRSNRELEQFAYAVSHDLQSPLRDITRHAGLLSDRFDATLDPDSQHSLRAILDGAERQTSMIRGLLDFSTAAHDANRNMVDTDCNVLVQLAMQHLRTEIEETRAVITAAALPVVRANDGRLLQVFQNLISNAMKYRGEGAPGIRISAALERDKWVFSVADNGIGLDMRYAERIFEPFHRLHSSSEYEGSGIGLALCRRIIERHGGRIWVEAEPGKGSTFYFTIPNRIAAATARAPADTPEAAPLER